MSKHEFSTSVRWIVVACSAALALSCSGTPTAPGGFLLVYVSQDGARPAPGKTIEIQGTSLRQTTDANGIAVFSVPAGTYVVRAYDIGTPGPPRPYVDQTVEVQPAHTSRAQFQDCMRCV